MMPLVVLTLVAVAAFIALFFGIALSLYQSQQKTYPGFGFWTVSFFVVAFAYAISMARIAVPVALSAVLSTTLFVVAAALRLEGALQFTGRGRLRHSVYLAPAVVALSSVYFSLVTDDIAMRNLAFSGVLGVVALAVGWTFLRYAPATHNLLYRLIGVCSIVFVAMLWLRAALWFFRADESLLTDSGFQVAYFAAVILFDLTWGMSLPILNSLRLDSELRASKAALEETVAELRMALAEIHMLTGLIPICSSCKKIRDDQGYWNQLEVYLADHADIEFTHSICPDCLSKLYPDIYGVPPAE